MRKWRRAFANPGKGESSYYNLFEDWELIEASFAQQYGIRLRRENNMSWDEFTTLLAGLNGETPLGRVVQIRSETDRERIKRFSPAEQKIRNDWLFKHRTVTDEKTRDKAVEGFHAMFKSLSERGG